MRMLQLNTYNLHRVMHDFHTLTKIRIVIFDADFHELLAYPADREVFCTMLRKRPEGEAACQKSDRKGCQQCAKTKELVHYRCHAGLVETVVPIFDRNGILAYVMFGQIVPQENRTDTIAKLKADYPAYSNLVDQIPVKSAEELKAAGTILQAITNYVMTNRWVTPGKSEFIRQIDRYIEEHLHQAISMEDICNTFQVGLTRLYELSIDYLGCGLAQYIRNQRILYAKKMLIETQLPITEIANAVGFADYNHFSRIFKQAAGMSARQYRKSAHGA